MARLRISDSWLHAYNDGSKLVSVESPNDELEITGSYIRVIVQFLAAGRASIVGSHCDAPPAGSTANLRMAGNTGSCPNK
jgi:hypothetical protein